MNMAELEKIEKVEKENDIKFKTDSIFEFKNLEKNNSFLLKHLEFQMSRQIYIGCIYVLTVMSGSFYGSYRQKSPPTETSWFSLFDLRHKSNFFNQYFVKKGWFWTSLIFIIYAIRVIHANKSFQAKKSVIRWILATSYWYIITQGFFGPSIVDRIFVFTGGKCVNHQSETQVFQVFEAYICKKIGGRWTNGTDISGHCFLLIHASLLLWEEISAFTYRPENWEFARDKNKILTMIFFSFVFLWWLMLVITAVYFHNFPEKLAGTIFGVLYWTLYNIIRYTRPNWFILLMPYDLEELEKYEL